MCTIHKLAVGFVAVSASVLASCAGPEVGLVANRGKDRVSVFDPDSSKLTDSVSISRPSNDDAYVLTSQPGGPAFVAFDKTIKLVQIDQSSAQVADTLRATHDVTELATFPEKRPLLLIAGGFDSSQDVISTITANNQVDRDTLNWPIEAIATCDDLKTLLVAVDNPTPKVHKFSISNNGSISATGQVYAAQSGSTRIPDVECAPGSKTGAALTQTIVSSDSGNSYVESFEISTMSGQNTKKLAGRFALSGVFSPSGDTFFARSGLKTRFGRTHIQRFDYGRTNGTFSSAKRVMAPAVAGKQHRSTLAINQDGSKLYALDTFNDRLLVLDPNTLSQLGSVSRSLDRPRSIVTARKED